MSEEGRGKDGWDGEASSCFIAWETFRAGVGVHCSRRIKVMVPLGRGPWAGFLGLPCVCGAGAVRVRGAGETKEGLANLLALGAGVQSRCARATSRYRVYIPKQVPMYIPPGPCLCYFQNTLTHSLTHSLLSLCQCVQVGTCGWW